MVLPRDNGAWTQTSELPDFSQVRGLRRLGPGRYTITSLRQRLLEEGRGCFYTAEPDSGSESDSCDPTRECFHIDEVVETTDETQDAVAGGRAPTVREDTRTPGNDGQVDPLYKKTKPRNLRNCETSRQNLMKTVSASSCLSKSLSRTYHIHLAEVSAEELERCIDRSLGTGSQNNLSAASPERARTSWRQQCCCVTCLSPRTPKHGAFETRCRLCSRWQQFSKPRARPLDAEGQPQKA